MGITALHNTCEGHNIVEVMSKIEKKHPKQTKRFSSLQLNTIIQYLY